MKMFKKNLKYLVVSLLICAPVFLIAANTGKVKGSVVDKITGQPLIGANLFLEGTHLGNSTDTDGYFFIINVKPGHYNLKVSYIGYHSITITDVLVRADLTSEFNIEMESNSIEMPTLEVVAERKMVQKDITSTRRVTERAELEDSPGLNSVSDVFNMHSGAIVDIVPQRINAGQGAGQLQIRDESLKNVHIRGGRGGEILFMVDGMPVTHPLYGGRDVLNLNVQEVEQIELLTGAFSAEYGQAQSGVVNITTRSGGIAKTGSMEYKSDRIDLFGESYNNDYLSFNLGGPLSYVQNALKFVHIPLPGELFFFSSGNINLDDTRMNNGRSRELLFENLDIYQRQNNEIHLNTKVDWNITPKFKVTGSYSGSFKEWTNFDWQWILSPDNTAQYARRTIKYGLKVNHFLSHNTFYNLSLGYLEVGYQASLDGKTDLPDYWGWSYDTIPDLEQDTFYVDTSYTGLAQPVVDPTSGFFTDAGYQDIWRDDLTKTYTFKFDIRSQVHKAHYLKAGFQAQYNDIQYVDIQDGGYFLSNYGEHVILGADPFDPPPGPYQEYGRTRWVFDSYPIIGGAYLEDKIESEALIVNAGVRMDFFSKGATVMDEVWQQKWEDATGLEADWKQVNYKISPRFGISFPISEFTVLFFSYGHFNQLPELHYYYRDPYTGGFTGNPGLDYESTILYEFGFTHQFSQNLALDIKSYQRDISKQIGTQQLMANLGLPVSLYDNMGYARSRGMEFELNKRYSKFTSGDISYTIQWATGYSSSSFEEYINSQTGIPNPIRERRLGWDRRHQVAATFTLQSPKNQPMSLLGLRLPDDWSLTMLTRVASGTPYTPGSYDPIENMLNQNSKELPWTYSMDLRFQKSFNLLGLRCGVFADVYNVLNISNAQVVNRWSGKPYQYGDVIDDSNQFYSWRDMILQRNPWQIADPLHAIFGLRVNL
jgi:outer membrane receptor protein involved in Fe transport